MIFDKYPYSNFHEMNDDWIIKTLREFDAKLDEFVAMNSLTYADPIEYDPDAIYAANTVVIYDTTAYVSKQACPAGMLPTNTDYWLEIFPFGALIDQLINNGIDAMTRTIDAYIVNANNRLTEAINAVPSEVDAWLAAHPDVTTTVHPRSISYWHFVLALQKLILNDYTCIDDNAQTIDRTEFTQGYISLDTGGETPAVSSCRTGYMTFPDGAMVYLSLDGYISTIYEYDENEQYLLYSVTVGPRKQAIATKSNHKYRVVVGTNSGEAMTPADIPFGAIMYQRYTSNLSKLQDAVTQLNDLVINGTLPINIDDFPSTSCIVSDSNTLTRSGVRYKSRQITADGTYKYFSVTANDNYAANVTFLTVTYPTAPTPGISIDSDLATGETGRHIIDAGKTEILKIPADCTNIMVAYVSNSNNVTPSDVSFCSNLYADMEAIKKTGLFTYDDIAQFGSDHVFTESFSFTIPYVGDYRNMLFTALASYTQNDTTEIPYINFYIGSGLSRTTNYEFGAKNEITPKTWRVVRGIENTSDITVNVVIPNGVTLTIRNFYNEYSDSVARSENGIRVYGHRAMPTTPRDSIHGVTLGAKAGYFAFVEIPKRLSDGTWIFYHDDTLVYDETYIRQADGSVLPSTYDGTLWSDISYNTAMSWDWGISTNANFAGTKPMTMEQFFTICGKTGMNPVLSIHPFPTSDQLAEIKTIAKKTGILDKLCVKAGVDRVGTLYSVFGNDIDTYFITIASGSQTANVITAAINAMNALTGCTARRVIELFSGTAYDAYFGSSTYDPFGMILNAGFSAGIAHQNGHYNPVGPDSTTITNAASMEWWNVNHGVTDFTNEYHWSNGLPW